jgi:hypothetical protein
LPQNHVRDQDRQPSDDGDLRLPKTAGITLDKQCGRWGIDTTQQGWVVVVIKTQQVAVGLAQPIQV